MSESSNAANANADASADATATTAAAPQQRTHRRMNPWVSFVGRRLVRTVVALWVIVTVAFVVLRFSGGDPVRNALGATASPELVAQRRATLGLNKPLPVQYAQYIAGLFHGDLGISIISGRSVSEIVATRLPWTVALALAAFVVILVFSIPIGMAMAVHTQGDRHRGSELVFTGITGFFGNIPDYLVAVILVSVLAVNLKLFPVAGANSAASFVLPVTALSISSICMLSRIARIQTFHTLNDDYVRTARGKRLSPMRIYWRHVMPNMVSTIMVLAGNTLAQIMTGTVLIEQVFNWPGMGTAFTTAITSRDYGIVQGLALVYGFLVLLITFLVDVVVALLERRSTMLETA
ncbi:ABC transporter permease [Bifidobacterium callitrichidarum]|uniref:ABC transporter permease n=1 Tax=Bifidobacterium callitrichidarum TaxID=2052941 RepID=A0A2U2NAV1_9BIFI|nr:ABC transporter permease [Bifidobacterium callitrichidarum]PWG66129.1 ABC transporter permease [Bifidobacterium callitrichidarum]